MATAYNNLAATIYALTTLWLKNTTRDLTTYNATTLGGDDKQFTYTSPSGLVSSYAVRLWDGFQKPRIPGVNILVGKAIPFGGKSNPQYFQAALSIHTFVLTSFYTKPEIADFVANEIANLVNQALRIGGTSLYDFTGATPLKTASSWWYFQKPSISRGNLEPGTAEIILSALVRFKGDVYTS